MIRMPKAETARMLDIHGWSAVLFGLALYVVVLTGAVVVFAHEIGAWSVSGHKMDGALAGKIDQSMVTLTEQVPEEYRHDVSLYQNSAGYLIAFFHTHEKNDSGMLADIGTRFVLDPEDFSIVSRHDGFADDMPDITSSFLEDFFVDLHVRLHAPNPIGLYLTGLLGLLLLVSAISGFIMHRNLIRDLFLSPRSANKLIKKRDKHTLAGTWSILFSIIVAFTGAFFSFATTLGLPVIAITAFEGDQQAAIEAVLGIPDAEDPTPSPFVGVEAIVSRVQQADAAGSLPTFISIEHPGRVDARVTTFHEPANGQLFGGSHLFNGATGEYLGKKPALGQQPSFGSDLISLVGVFHFGLFAGMLSKIIWLSLGLATCYVTYTGLKLWVARREQQARWRLMGRLTDITAYGTVIAMNGAAIGFLATYHRQPDVVIDWTINGFFAAALVSILVGFIRPAGAATSQILQALMGLSLLVLPIARLITADGGWSVYRLEDNAVVIGMDISLLVLGALFVWLALKATSVKPITSMQAATETTKGATTHG